MFYIKNYNLNINSIYFNINYKLFNIYNIIYI